MDQKLRKQAVELTEHIMRTYYCQRDIDTMLHYMAQNATWIGPGEREKKYTLYEMRTYFEQGKDSVPSCEVSDPDLRAVDLGEDYCLVTGSMTIRTVPGSQLLLQVDQRVSFTFRFNGGRFQVVHMHISNPYGEMDRDEYFPHKIGSQSYRYLQQLLREKTEVLDMIAGNINGGLKGSNDDSTFSYFYVNEGLARMLGYTHDEFMEKTSGTAVGAVYPPDLPAALADCERCFAQGPVYSTEYRMEKKDGSLIWVLDSGRKMVDSEGITRINSIIMDITPLKQALFELEVERERYRIALEHITGAMCEYDIDKDVFTLYRKAGGNEERVIEPFEILDFSREICSGTLANSEDGASVLSLCTGKSAGSVELRTVLPYRDGQWYWVQFSCSLIYDHAGTPVRAIGMLKDITAEKQRNLELLNQARHDGLTGLLNQTAVRQSIEIFLAQSGEAMPFNCALLMLDLDRFKEINDFNGHAYGDQVLIKTARILEQTMGADSILGRLGGDEFLVLIKHTDSDDVLHMAEEIIYRVREIGADKDLSISCSIGIARRARREEPISQFFERADRALYHAKNHGRDGYWVD